jgi:hypothetical protein
MVKGEEKHEQQLVFIIMSTFLVQMRNYHYMTDSYEHHTIVDQFINEFTPLYDKFIEVSISLYGPLKNVDYSLDIRRVTRKNIGNFIGLFSEFLTDIRNNYTDNSNLLSICDEIETHLDIMRYKLSISRV